MDDGGERYRYVADEAADIRVGDEVTFVLDNTGTLIHDLNVTDPDGRTLAAGDPVAPGADGTVTVRFETSGPHRIACLVDDHLLDHQMFAFVEVTDRG